jgi:uncharacterized protein YjbJ (UPF0337 family)
MGENIDQMKGTAKEKAGQLKDDPELEAEGKRDQAKGDLKEGVDDAADKIKHGAHTPPPSGRLWGAGRAPAPNSLRLGCGFAAHRCG